MLLLFPPPSAQTCFYVQDSPFAELHQFPEQNYSKQKLFAHVNKLTVSSGEQFIALCSMIEPVQECNCRLSYRYIKKSLRDKLGCGFKPPQDLLHATHHLP